MNFITLIIFITLSTNVRAGKLTINWLPLQVGPMGTPTPVPPLVLDEGQYNMATLNGNNCSTNSFSSRNVVAEILDKIMKTEKPGSRKIVDSYQLEGGDVVKVSFLSWELFAVNKEHVCKTGLTPEMLVDINPETRKDPDSFLPLVHGFRLDYPQFFSVGFMYEQKNFV